MDYKTQIKEFHGIDFPHGKDEEIYLPDGREFMVDKWEFTGNDITYNNVYNLGNYYQADERTKNPSAVPIVVDQRLDSEITDYIAKYHKLALDSDDEFDPNYAPKSSVAPFATRP